MNTATKLAFNYHFGEFFLFPKRKTAPPSLQSNQHDQLVAAHNSRLASLVPTQPGEPRPPGSKLTLHREPDVRKSDPSTRDLNNCKARPDHAKDRPRTAGASGTTKRRFIPWC